ncbi:MAG: PHB depolymerase family esterase [Lysobacterales bacterium]|jgi:polyhydroxybutyrate depolymerase
MTFYQWIRHAAVLLAVSLAPVIACADGLATHLPDPVHSNGGGSRPQGASLTDCHAGNLPRGRSRHTLESEGVEREYVLYVPRAYTPKSAMPLVLDLHGSGSNPGQELELDGLATAAERRGFAVVLPVALRPMPKGGQTWNVPMDQRFPDDIEFLSDVLDDVPDHLCIDRHRIYITGFSGGARLASAAACRLSSHVAALAAVGGLRKPDHCERPVPVLAFHGTADPINPYFGGGPDYWQHSIPEALMGWATQNGCQTELVQEHLGPDAERWSTMDCAANSEVMLYRLVGAGHIWPGSSLELPQERFGLATDSVNATRIMLDFFESHRLADQ